MNVGGRAYRTIWVADNGETVKVIDQTRLPYEFVVAELDTVEQAVHAIQQMLVRGAPLIGATAAYGMCLAMRKDPGDENMRKAYDALASSRPTAVNLRWALDRLYHAIRTLPAPERQRKAYETASEICDQDVAICKAIGQHGIGLIRAAFAKTGGRPVNILTHCNAGWLATVDWGTALAPIYAAHDEDIPVHVWVDETRPRNQGAQLTAWELAEYGIDHTLVTDNAGGHLMQRGLVDLCIVGTDRTTAAGDVCNKIGTYLKALAARDNDVPFYVGLPSPTIDWAIRDGLEHIPIEQRDGDEVSKIRGRTEAGLDETVAIAQSRTRVRNDAFDVTPARLVSGLITERGLCEASHAGLAKLFPQAATG
ncbi:MAG: S-methyl-5-thioribose-1-phosphate isomerase [Woeseia sp.]